LSYRKLLIGNILSVTLMMIATALDYIIGSYELL